MLKSCDNLVTAATLPTEEKIVFECTVTIVTLLYTAVTVSIEGK
ncbi:hypothetical protein A2U01_0078087, partial [Trifolium medium]|nr:hypothetical protein [Trifolium medium]